MCVGLCFDSLVHSVTIDACMNMKNMMNELTAYGAIGVIVGHLSNHYEQGLRVIRKYDKMTVYSHKERKFSQ